MSFFYNEGAVLCRSISSGKRFILYFTAYTYVLFFLLNHRKFISLYKEFIFARERAVLYKRLPTLEELANDWKWFFIKTRMHFVNQKFLRFNKAVKTMFIRTLE